MLEMMTRQLNEAKIAAQKMIQGEQGVHPWYKVLDQTDFAQALVNLFNQMDFTGLSLLRVFYEFGGTLGVDEDQALNGLYQVALSYTYPQTAQVPDIKGLIEASSPYYEVFRLVNMYEKKLNKTSFLSKFHFNLLSSSEVADLEDDREYQIVIQAFRHHYIYEMMKLNYEVTGHSTIEHIVGVHHMAMFIARQIKAKGFKIDLGIVSASAALHDIGKFGCKPEEKPKVAYYHYYYSDEWFYRNHIKYIRNIAVNHSTWDLELEHLSMEALVLIYSDFRVKRHKDLNWPHAMKFFGLEESFRVILDKLDHVDDKKEKRYRKVYDKLVDFERFLVRHGVAANFDESPQVAPSVHNTIPSSEQILVKLKDDAIERNLQLMYTLRTEESLLALLDDAKSSRTAREFRRYILLLEQFSKYLAPTQKLLTLDFLFSQLVTFEEDLRNQAAQIMGTIIASFDEPYTKYLPPTVDENVFKLSKSSVLRKYIDDFLDPETSLSKQKDEWIGYALSQLLKRVLQQSKIISHTVDLVLEKLESAQADKRIYLMQSILVLPLSKLSESELDKLYTLVKKDTLSQNLNLRLKAYEGVYHLLNSGYQPIVDLALDLTLRPYDTTYERFLKGKINKRLLKHGFVLDGDFGYADISPQDMTSIYLGNLKSATPVAVKQLHLEMILKHMLASPDADCFYAAIHYCNLLKNSFSEEIRDMAGRSLVTLIKRLSKQEVNEVAIELLRGLEIENYGVSKKIPRVLGRVLVDLDPSELQEIIDDLIIKVKIGSDNLKAVIIETIAFAITAGVQRQRKASFNQNVLKQMLGLIMVGLVQYDKSVHITAFNALCSHVLSSYHLTLEEKGEIFKGVHRKVYAILEECNDQLQKDPLNYAYGLNKLYAFLTDYLHEKGHFDFSSGQKVAYFPGTFDPFSLGQLKVVSEITKEGYQVYIALDTFKWKRRTQPYLLRRMLINQTIASEFDVLLLPKTAEINFDEAEAHQALKALFHENQAYLVLGEDMLVSQDLYKDMGHGINEVPHLIITRKSLTKPKRQQAQAIKDRLSLYETITINEDLERITPEQIRKSIDHHLDLSDMIDPLAATSVYAYNMYKNEPPFKELPPPKSTHVTKQVDVGDDLKQVLYQRFNVDLKTSTSQATDTSRGILTIVSEHDQAIEAVAVYRGLFCEEWTRCRQDDAFKSDYVDAYVENTMVIEALNAIPARPLHNQMATMLTELLVSGMNEGYEYCVYFANQGMMPVEVLKTFRDAGFIELKGVNVLIADLKRPVTVLLDIQSTLKEAYRKDDHVRQVLQQTRDSLLQNVVKRHPKQVVLAFDRTMMYDKINLAMTAINYTQGHEVGPYMAVPFGELFKRWQLPYSITKALHTERVYEKTLKYFDVRAYPHYQKLSDQIKIISKFNKPVVLIDDLLDKGLRLQAVEEDFKKQNITIQKIVVGVMSQRGKHRIEQKGYSVQAAYYVKNMAAWYVESALYPYVGGDSYWQKDQVVGQVLPSINKILPYYGTLDPCSTAQKTFSFSEGCLVNAKKLLMALEHKYKAINQKTLEVGYLYDVFVTPRKPQYGPGLTVNDHMLPSAMITSDLNRLNYLKGMLGEDK